VSASARLYDWSELTRDDRDAWSAFRAAEPGLRSPYFTLGYADAVAATGGRLQVLKVERGGAPEAFLPLHRSRTGMAYPPGGPLSDWHGFIAPPESAVDAAAALKAVGLAGYRFEGAPETDRALAAAAETRTVSHIINLSDGPDTWWARRRRALRALARNERKLDEQGLRVEVVLDDRTPGSLQALFGWKSAQLRSTRQPDLFRPGAWPRRLLERLHAEVGPDFRGLLSTLRIDGAPAAAHFGMISGGVLHYWFPAYDPAFGRYGPGGLLLKAMAEGARELGLREIDLGKGDYRYKREFADAGAPIASGVVAAGPVGQAYKAAAALSRARLPLGPGSDVPARAFRRLNAALSMSSVGARR
jgi:CelD/BcsL family acetyltransferase involved in cellulose biosynthesis